jgi:hypothetical protein
VWAVAEVCGHELTLADSQAGGLARAGALGVYPASGFRADCVCHHCSRSFTAAVILWSRYGQDQPQVVCNHCGKKAACNMARQAMRALLDKDSNWGVCLPGTPRWPAWMEPGPDPGRWDRG